MTHRSQHLPRPFSSNILGSLSVSRFIALCTTVTGTLLFLSGFQVGVTGPASPVTIQAAGIAVLTLGLWATGVVPEFFTSLLFLFLCTIFSVAAPESVFSGFQTQAMWLIFGGVVIATTVTQVGLGSRLIGRILALIPSSYFGIVAVVCLTGVALSFAVPTALGRAILLTPIAVQLASQLGFDEGSDGRTGIVMAAGMGTTLPAFAILPANVPNLVMSASAETLYGVHFSFGPYFALNFPVLGGFSILATISLNWWFFREEPGLVPEKSQVSALALTPRETKLSLVLVATVLLWTTDFLHGVSPSVIAMGAALFCVAPGIGIIPTADFAKKINFAPMFFVAGVVGFGVVVSEVGLSELTGDVLVRAFREFNFDNGFLVYLALIVVGMLVALATMLPAAPAVMTPVASQLAIASEWPVEAVLMTQVPTWIIIPLSYMAPPLFATISLGNISSGQVARLMLWYFVLGLLIALPLHFVWARFLGFFP